MIVTCPHCKAEEQFDESILEVQPVLYERCRECGEYSYFRAETLLKNRKRVVRDGQVKYVEVNP